MDTKKDNVTRLKNTSLHSVSLLIKKSTYQDYQPREKDLYLRDTELKGFYIRVRTNGTSTYNVSARLKGIGKKVYVTIGNCDLLTASDARDEARRLLADIKSGHDPKGYAHFLEGNEITLEYLANEYIMIRDHLSKSTQEDYVYRVPQQLGPLAKKPIKDITVDDFVAWWGKAKAKGSRKVALRYVSSLYTYAIARKYVRENVAKDFRKGILGGIPASQPKQTHIPKDELEDWVASFVKQSVPHPRFQKLWDLKAKYWNDEPTIRENVRDYIMFLLVTGKRKGEVAHLTWADVDFEKKVVILKKTKSGKVDVIPMTRYLWYMLKYRNESNFKDDTYVFPNRYRSGPIIDIRRALEKINKGALRGHTTAHDLRRTFATMAKELGMEKHDIAILLNHSQRDVTEGYIQTSLVYKRTNLDRVSNAMLGHIQGWSMVYWYGAEEGWDTGPDSNFEEQGIPYYR